MKKINKKGSTLLELIISIALISMILVFLMRLLIDLNNTETNNDYAKDNQIVRAEIIRMVENDLTNNTITGIDSNGSSNNSLVINFTFKDGSSSKITATENKFTYKTSSGTIRTWTMEDGTIYTKKANVNYNYEGDIYTLQIDIEVHTANDNNKYKNNNLLDDILLSYIGKYSDFNTGITCLGKAC